MGKTEFGVAMRNFQTYPEIPDAQALIDYGVSPGLISGSAVGEGETLSVHGDAEGYPFDRRVVITFGE